MCSSWSSTRRPTRSAASPLPLSRPAPVAEKRVTKPGPGGRSFLISHPVRVACSRRGSGRGWRPEIDLAGVNYPSSSGIALLLEAAAATRADRTLTVHATEGTPPTRVLALSGLHGLTTDALAVRIG